MSSVFYQQLKIYHSQVFKGLSNGVSAPNKNEA